MTDNVVRMNRRFALPEDWEPSLKKPYEKGDVKFEVWLRYEGQITETNMHHWIYCLVVGNKILDAAPFYWDPSDHPMTDNDVANHAIAWYKQIDIPHLMAEMMDNNVVGMGFDPQIRSVALVDVMFYPNVDVDFEVVWFNQIGDSWKVVLSTNIDSNYYEVVHYAEKDETYVNAYNLVDGRSIGDDEIDEFTK